MYNDVIYRLPVGSVRIQQLTKPSLWAKLVAWLKDYDSIQRNVVYVDGLPIRHTQRARPVPPLAMGELAETMRRLN